MSPSRFGTLLLWSAAAGCGGPDLPGRVLVLGVDGLERTVVEAMVAEGDLPELAALLREGVVADVEVDRPVLSPVVWTTYATGYPPALHGVTGWNDGAGHPFTGADVRAWRLWDTATAEGVPVLAVHWLLSWPATPVDGLLVTDRFVWAFPLDKPDDPDLLELDRRHHAALPFTVHPAAAEPLAQACVPGEAWLRSHPLGYQVAASGVPFHPLQRDETAMCVLEAHWGARGTRLGLVYLQGVDPVSHLYWPFFDPEIGRLVRREPELRARAVAEAWARQGDHPRPYPLPHGGTREELDQAARWVPDMYRWVDGAVGRARALLGPEDLLVVLSDHGFRASPAQPLLHGSHGDLALLMAVGKGVAAVGPVAPFREVDVGPTLLALAGLPVADDMPGRVRDDVFHLSRTRRGPSRVLDRTGVPRAADLSEAYGRLHEQLRALGYLDPEEALEVGASRRVAPPR